MTNTPPLSFNLGPSEISNIVDKLLTPLAPLFPNLTPKDQYALLFSDISKLALNKTFSTKNELASLVQNISKTIIDKFTSPTATPSQLSLDDFNPFSTNSCTENNSFVYCAEQ